MAKTAVGIVLILAAATVAACSSDKNGKPVAEQATSTPAVVAATTTTAAPTLPTPIKSHNDLVAYLNLLPSQLEPCVGFDALTSSSCTHDSMGPALLTFLQLTTSLNGFPKTKEVAGTEWENAAKFANDCADLKWTKGEADRGCLRYALFPAKITSSIESAFYVDTQGG